MGIHFAWGRGHHVYKVSALQAAWKACTIMFPALVVVSLSAEGYPSGRTSHTRSAPFFAESETPDPKPTHASKT